MKNIINYLRKMSDLKICLLIFLFAFLLKIFVLSDYSNSPFFDALIQDSKIYHQWAQAILAGDILGREVYYQPPLYAYFLAFIMFLGGSYFAIYSIQILLSSITACLLFYIAKPYGGRKLGIMVSGLFVLYGTVTFYDLKILAETLSVFLYVLWFYLISGATRKRDWFISGLVLGALVLCKTETLLLLPLTFLYLWFFFDQLSSQKKIQNMVCFFIPVLLIVSIVTIRNFYVEKEFVLLSNNGGINFYIGNNDKAKGALTAVEGVSPDVEYQKQDMLELARQRIGKPITSAAASGFWFAEGLKFIFGNPGKYILLEMKKLKLIFSDSEKSSFYNAEFEKEHFTPTLKLLFIKFHSIVALALTGMVLFIPYWKKFFLLYAIVVFQIFKILLFFYDARFRMPLIPFLIIFAVLAFLKIFQATYRPGKLRMNAYLTVFLCAFFITEIMTWGRFQPTRLKANAYYTLGEILYDKKRFAEARKAYYESSNLDKNSWMPVLGISKVLAAEGKMELAAQMYRDAFPSLDEDFKKMILRDKNLDRVRDYIRGSKTDRDL